MKKIIVNTATSFVDADKISSWLLDLGFNVEHQNVGDVFADGILAVDHDTAEAIYARFYAREVYTRDEQRAYIGSLLI